MSKYLVLWSLDVGRINEATVKAVMQMPKYAEGLKKAGKLVARYHVVGRHGGAWIYDAASNEEMDRLLAQAPVYNFATYEVLPLAEMDEASPLLG